MTVEEVEKISRYANGVYYRNYDQWELQGESFEDFRQDLILLALENPKDSFSLLMKRYRFRKMCAVEAIPYRLENMKPFSSLVEEEEGLNDLIEQLGGEIEAEVFPENKLSCIGEIASYLYDKPMWRDLFLDYMHGQSIGGSRQRDCRIKMFNHCKEILQILRRNEKIDSREEERLKELLKDMRGPAPVPKQHDDTAQGKSYRAYYERNKEKIAQKKKALYEKEKQARLTGKGEKRDDRRKNREADKIRKESMV